MLVLFKMNDILTVLVLMIIFGTVLTVLFIHVSKTVHSEQKEKIKPSTHDLTEIYKDIKIEPYGCFTNIDDKFFLKKINPYTSEKIFDSGIIIEEHRVNEDFTDLINRVLNNGFDIFAKHIISKYNGKYSDMDILDIAALGKLAGYNYITIYKTEQHKRNATYLTYSPPMDNTVPLNYSDSEYNSALSKSDLPNYTLTPKAGKYANEENITDDTELSCGYPCYINDKVGVYTDSSGVERNYMCGSVAYPNIKTAPRYAIYKIKEIK